MFDVDIERPETNGTSGNGGGSKLSADQWNELHDLEARALGLIEGEVEEISEPQIGVVTVGYDLGIHERGNQQIPVDSKEYKDQEWRLEKNTDGSQKDLDARVENTYYDHKMQKCLVYPRKPAPLFTIAVDFPEIIVDRSEFFGENSKPAPYRVIFGQEGFVVKDEDGSIPDIIPSPFNLNPVNVNRGKEGASPLYAIAKNSKLHKLAKYCDVLDEDGVFKPNYIGKLIGKVCSFQLTAKWKRGVSKSTGREYKILSVDAQPASSLGKRDREAYESSLSDVIPAESFGYLGFNAAQCLTGKDGDAQTLIKQTRKSIINTMLRANNFASNYKIKEFKDPEKQAPLYLQMKELISDKMDTDKNHPRTQQNEETSNTGSANSGVNPSADTRPETGETNTSSNESTQSSQTVDNYDFDDDIPF